MSHSITSMLVVYRASAMYHISSCSNVTMELITCIIVPVVPTECPGIGMLRSTASAWTPGKMSFKLSAAASALWRPPPTQSYMCIITGWCWSRGWIGRLATPPTTSLCEEAYKCRRLSICPPHLPFLKFLLISPRVGSISPCVLPSTWK